MLKRQEGLCLAIRRSDKIGSNEMSRKFPQIVVVVTEGCRYIRRDGGEVASWTPNGVAELSGM